MINRRLLELPEDTPVDKIDFKRYRFHEQKKRYLKVGDKNGCDENMRFFAVPNDERLGRCDCDWFQCSRPLLYDDKTDKCYWAWSTVIVKKIYKLTTNYIIFSIFEKTGAL